MDKKPQSLSISQIKAGDQASLTRAFSQADVLAFAQVTGDQNPAHVDEAYAKGTMFKTRIVHGMLVASLFSALLGVRLPGLGTIYMGQTLQFRRPVKLDESVTATITVKEVMPEKNRVIFDCLALNAAGEAVITGEATVLAPRETNENKEEKP